MAGDGGESVGERARRCGVTSCGGHQGGTGEAEELSRAAVLVVGVHLAGARKFPNDSWASRDHEICFGA